MIAEIHNRLYGDAMYAGQRMTKAEFIHWQSDDNYVYEFDNGLLIPGTSMRQDGILMLKQLTRHFAQTEAYSRGGELLAEVDVWLTESQMRRPDVAFYSAEQLAEISRGSIAIPHFVVEFASESDNEFKSVQKRHEYFDAGVRVIWWVFPIYKEVFMYTSPTTITGCQGDDLLSAAPALPDLQLTVTELFR